MEELIKQFLTITGNGDGYGYGNGNGDGYGNGNGNGDGNGYGYGYVDGDGYGYGNGNGYGNGDGNGDGDGNGNGNGYGNGYGNGDGNGDGDGNGNGYGDGNGYGIIFSSVSGKRVYYIDKIPCTFVSIKRNIALVSVINAADFSSTQMYVAKKWNLFAHGESIKEASEAVDVKYYSTVDRDTAILEFKNQFKADTLYSNAIFYRWHTILTGSCESGKNHWLKENGISLNDRMTVDQFIELTKNAYGGEIIRSALLPDFQIKNK